MTKTPKAAITASAERKLRNLKPFQPGQSGNPAGRAKGSRNKLGEAFIEALHADFGKHGISTIAKVREEHPETYVRVIAGILPKELKIETTSDLTDEQLDARIRQLAQFLEIGISGTAGGTTETVQPGEADPVSTLH